MYFWIFYRMYPNFVFICIQLSGFSNVLYKTYTCSSYLRNYILRWWNIFIILWFSCNLHGQYYYILSCSGNRFLYHASSDILSIYLVSILQTPSHQQYEPYIKHFIYLYLLYGYQSLTMFNIELDSWRFSTGGILHLY